MDDDRKLTIKAYGYSGLMVAGVISTYWAAIQYQNKYHPMQNVDLVVKGEGARGIPNNLRVELTGEQAQTCLAMGGVHLTPEMK